MSLKIILQEINKSKGAFLVNVFHVLGYLQVEAIYEDISKRAIELILNKAKLYYQQAVINKKMVDMQRWVRSGSYSARYPLHFNKADLWKRVLPKYEELEKELASIDDQINDVTKAIASLALEQA